MAGLKKRWFSHSPTVVVVSLKYQFREVLLKMCIECAINCAITSQNLRCYNLISKYKRFIYREISKWIRILDGENSWYDNLNPDSTLTFIEKCYKLPPCKLLFCSIVCMWYYFLCVLQRKRTWREYNCCMVKRENTHWIYLIVAFMALINRIKDYKKYSY